MISVSKDIKYIRMTEEQKRRYGHRIGGKTICMNNNAMIEVNKLKMKRMLDENRSNFETE